NVRHARRGRRIGDRIGGLCDLVLGILERRDDVELTRCLHKGVTDHRIDPVSLAPAEKGRIEFAQVEGAGIKRHGLGRSLLCSQIQRVNRTVFIPGKYDLLVVDDPADPTHGLKRFDEADHTRIFAREPAFHTAPALAPPSRQTLVPPAHVRGEAPVLGRAFLRGAGFGFVLVPPAPAAALLCVLLDSLSHLPAYNGQGVYGTRRPEGPMEDPPAG